MAKIKSAEERERTRLFVKTSKEKAQHLLAHSEEISSNVFTSPDNYGSFLNLIARFHHYDARNLLLIWEKCPSATYLAGYKTWEEQLPKGSRILKREHIGKGIELLAPFTDGFATKVCLVWHTRNVFDISQTTVAFHPPVFDSGFILDDAHEYFLTEAITQVLSTKYGRSVVIQPPSQRMQELGLPGQITEKTVIGRSDISRISLLSWLTEALCQLAIAEMTLSSSSEKLMRDSIRYCLFRIWNLEDSIQPPGSNMQLKSVSSQYLAFLHLLRDTSRELNNLVCSCYLARRQDQEEEDDLELEALYSLTEEP